MSRRRHPIIEPRAPYFSRSHAARGNEKTSQGSTLDPRLLYPRHWPSWLLVGIFYLLGFLPFPLLWASGMGIGYAGYFLAGTRRRVALRNLALCFPDLTERARRRLAARHFGYLGVATCIQGLVWISSRRRLGRIVKLRHRERVDGPIQNRRNLIIMVPHFVGLELGGAAFTALVHPGLYMYQKIRNPVIDHQMRRSRSRFGAVSVERNDDLWRMIRKIHQGTPLFYLPDQDPGRRGIFVPFCGTATATVPMLSRFARLGAAQVLPVHIRYLPWGRGLEMIFDPPLDPFPTDDQAADTALMNRTIEARIRTTPAQYFWVHRRFKTRPPGELPIYPSRRH